MEEKSHELKKLEKEIEEKNRIIEQLQEKLNEKQPQNRNYNNCKTKETNTLTNAEISRYSRQLILPELGVQGQISLKKTSILIVGAGGLGCPAAIYLTAAGVGKLGIVDYDEVDISNLHRQILHTESRVGVCKSKSVAQSCQQLNSGVEFVSHHTQLDSSTALDIIKKYDIVLDATDNVATRYLLNDACILAGKPLVSGSALRFEGHLTVYNYQGGPCYRCLYPKPPPPETVTNCSDGGVLGVIPGIIGSLQALEAIKIAVGLQSSYSQKLLMFDGMDGTFRVIKLRGRQSACPVCGDTPTITQLIDYEQFCGARASDKDKPLEVLGPDRRISAKSYRSMLDKGEPHVLVDVRQPVEMDICQLPFEAINIPINRITSEDSLQKISEKVDSLKSSSRCVPVVCVCRRGNDSQIAVQKLTEHFNQSDASISDIAGGLTSWAKTVDPDFPTY